ncbi:MAG: anthranilate phosphoribosyltransferase, partial [Terriglobales bacterium]
MILDAIRRITARESLSREEARALMEEVLAGRARDAEITSLLVALHTKGESVEEIVGFAEAMRAAARPLPLVPMSAGDVLVDTCGTGGDARGTFNISTTAAFVVAGAGVRVAKHGNRSVTSKCGSADVLEALGVRLEFPPERLAACLNEVGIAFLYAPALHSAMKHVQA